MKKQGWSFRFSNNAYADGQNAAAFYRAFRGLGRDILSGLYVYEDEAWAVGGECSAICRAALKAMGVSAIITKPLRHHPAQNGRVGNGFIFSEVVRIPRKTR